MIVHRFMSKAEYKDLIAGVKLCNFTNHKERGKLTTSIGFCFFTEDPDVAIHWLSGCAYPELCVTMEVPDSLLTESVGTYRDPQRDNLFSSERHTIDRREYCCTQYSLSAGVKVLAVTERYEKYAALMRMVKAVALLR